MPRHSILRRRAFTLVELLTVIAIIGILAAIIIPTVGKVRLSAVKATTTSNLRQIGLAIQLYTEDYRGTLPGPIKTAQYNTYRSTNPDTLGHYLWSYLGLSEMTTTTKTIPVFANPAHTRLRRADTAPVFLACQEVQDKNGVTLDGMTNQTPWGYPGRAAPNGQPRSITFIPDRAQSWALQDADADHPYAQGAGWQSQLPEHPVFGNIRTTLYFDWHVEARPVAP
ncbi:hypothetical protein OPIT5_24515 [Opitutaceae bacterium TAV5]|nr:hypothetical protein OPIT5_24515 [Opitutaceae bacterium TAV5]